MHRSKKMVVFAGAGAVLAAVLALVIISLGSGSSGKVEATNLTPTVITPVATATPLKTPQGTTGALSLSGVYDLHVHVVANPATALYFCMARQDAYGTTAANHNVKAALVCYSDVPGQSDPSSPLPNSLVCAPACISNVNPDVNLLGPPPPPPYSGTTPQKAAGSYVQSTDTLTTTVCFKGVGGSIGPNIVADSVISNASATPDVNLGVTNIYVNQSAANCAALIHTGPIYGATLETDFYRVSDLAGVATGTLGPAILGRDGAHALDYDGDGCLDKDELDKARAVKQCGDDPTNPLDSDHNYAGTYDITVQTTEADLCVGGSPRPTTAYPLGCMGQPDGTYLPGGYFNCIGTIAHTKVTPQPKYEPISSKAFCYVDNPLNAVNPQAAGASVCPAAPYGRCSQGGSGISPPSFPPKATGAVEAGLQCLNTSDDDGDTIPNDGCTQNWGDNNATNATTVGTDTHTNLGLLKGWLDNNNNVMVLEGCFLVDAPALFAPATYARLVVDQHSGAGTVDVWVGQANCNKPAAPPDPIGHPGDLDNAQVIITQQNSTDDTDRDGCTDARELGGGAANWGTAAGGGLRDPFWTFDFFDPDGNKANGLADINFIANPAHIFKTEGLNGYTWRADRTGVQTGSANPAPPASVVALGPPDRAIGLADVNLSARQFANSCA